MVDWTEPGLHSRHSEQRLCKERDDDFMFGQAANVPKFHSPQKSRRIKQDCNDAEAVHEHVMEPKYAEPRDHI